MQYRGWKIYAHYYRHSFHIFYFNFCVVYASNNRRCQLHVYVWKDIIALLAAPVLHVKYICGVIFPGNVVMVQTVKMLMDIFAHCNFFSLLIFRIVRLVFIDLCCTHSCVHVMSFSLAQSRNQCCCCCWFCSIELHSSRLM